MSTETATTSTDEGCPNCTVTAGQCVDIDGFWWHEPFDPRCSGCRRCAACSGSKGSDR